MTTDTSKITGAADELSAGLTKGGTAAKTLGAEIANAIKALDGRITTLETATPPVQPPIDPPVEPPPTSTKGKITNFNAANGSIIKVDGVNAEVEHDASKSYSIANPDPYTLRFEVHSGDRWSSPNHTDPTTSERSEIEIWDGRKPAGTNINFSYGFVMEPGTRNTADWMVLGQWHQTNSGGNPPFAFAMYGERFHVLIRDNTGRENRIFADTKDIQRGHKYQLRGEVKFASPGYCRIWRDDVQIVNFNGEIGFGSGEQYYWKNGVYRNEAPEVIACSYSNLYFG